ncbi:MAG: apolipoprotein N-acyltransferase [Saprospiraceae bacterium]|nr:apolipoprotein N-acyltransferase [Saprospiraceae bacterium]
MNRNIKFGGIVIFLLTLTFCGYNMSLRPLWSWWTLPLLLAFWALIVFVFEKKYNKRWLLLSTLSGVGLTLGFPISPLTALMFVGFVPLLMVEKEISAQNALTTEGGKKHGILKYAFNAFIIWNIGSTFWVGNAGLIAGSMANYLNALFMAWTFMAFHKTAEILRGDKKAPLPGFQYALVLIAYWLAWEFLHLNWELSWPWLVLGNAFAQKPEWVQWYEYTGVFGGSLWILILNVLVFKIASKAIYEKQRATRLTWMALLILAMPIALSKWIYDQWAEKCVSKRAEKYAEVVAVQPNYEPHYEKFDVPTPVQMQKFLRLSMQKVDSTTDYLIFPETSFDFHNVNNFASRSEVQELQNFVHQYPKLNLILGIDALRVYAEFATQKPSGLPQTVREFYNQGGSITYWENYNAATQINAHTEGGHLEIYKKSKLVPGPEILPYGFLFGWAKPLFRQFGGTVGGLGMQSERTAFKSQDGTKKVGTAICYESIYGDFCRGYVQAGAQALFVLTNDGWWDNTPGYQQHQKFASLRAIELRREVVRSANTGTSCFVNLRGDVEQPTAYGIDAAIKQRIVLNDDITFYVRYGDWIAWLAVGSALSLLVYWLFVSVKRRFQ